MYRSPSSGPSRTAQPFQAPDIPEHPWVRHVRSFLEGWSAEKTTRANDGTAKRRRKPMFPPRPEQSRPGGCRSGFRVLHSFLRRLPLPTGWARTTGHGCGVGGGGLRFAEVGGLCVRGWTGLDCWGGGEGAIVSRGGGTRPRRHGEQRRRSHPLRPHLRIATFTAFTHV